MFRVQLVDYIIIEFLGNFLGHYKDVFCVLFIVLAIALKSLMKAECSNRWESVALLFYASAFLSSRHMSVIWTVSCKWLFWSCCCERRNDFITMPNPGCLYRIYSGSRCRLSSIYCLSWSELCQHLCSVNHSSLLSM